MSPETKLLMITFQSKVFGAYIALYNHTLPSISSRASMAHLAHKQ